MSGILALFLGAWKTLPCNSLWELRGPVVANWKECKGRQGGSTREPQDSKASWKVSFDLFLRNVSCNFDIM